MENQRLVLEVIGVVAALGIVFFLGFQYGMDVESQRSTVEWNFTGRGESESVDSGGDLHGDRRAVHDQHPGSRVVDSTASFDVDGYEISFKTENNDQYLRENGWSGYTWGNGTIVIKSGSSVSWTYDVCRHEVKHNEFPGLNHSEMKDRDSVDAQNTCLELLYLLRR